VAAAQRAGVERFVFFSVLDASTHHRARLHRAKALAEQAVREADMRSTVFAPSLVYAPGDRWLTLLERLALLPVVPVSGSGRAVYQPIWAQDVAACVMAALARGEGQSQGEGHGRGEGHGGGGEAHERFELAGPETLSLADIVRLLLRAQGRRRMLVHVPTPVVSRALRLLEATMGTGAFATWDEAELMEVSMTSNRGSADAELLGVAPEPMGAVLMTPEGAAPPTAARLQAA